MQCTGNDYIVIDNRSDAQVSCAESLCVRLVRPALRRRRRTASRSSSARDAADAKMTHVQPRRQSEGRMAGNCIRCVAKYLYDNGIVHERAA